MTESNKKNKKSRVDELTVSYQNAFNKVFNSDLTPNELNLLYGIIGLLKTQKKRKIILSFDYVKELANWREDMKPNVLAKSLDKFAKRSVGSVFRKMEKKNGHTEIKGFVLFTDFKISAEDKTFTLTRNFSSDARAFFEELTESFTNFKFSEFIALKKVSSKTLYRHLIQYHNTGKYLTKIDDLKLLMGYKEDFKTKEFIITVNNAMREINEVSSVIEDVKVSRILKSDNKTINVLQFDFNIVDEDSLIEANETKEEVSTKEQNRPNEDLPIIDYSEDDWTFLDEEN